MVRMQNDNCTICADASLMAPLSLAVVLVCCAVRMRAQQRKCPGCSHWKAVGKFARHETCSDCRSPMQQRGAADEPAAAATAPAPSEPSPPLSMFGRPTGCIDQLTTVERAAIVTLHGVGWTGRDIAHELRCSEQTVSLWLTRWNETRWLEDSERSGRPRCTTRRQDETMEQYAREKKFTTPAAIQNAMELECSKRTVRRRLDEVDLLGRVSATEYVLDAEDIRRRLSFAEGYADKDVAWWSTVIFSDETHIEVFGRSRVWVQRPRGERYNPDYIRQHMPHSERVSLWGCFCAKGVGQAEIFVDAFDAVRYVDILDHNLLQTARHFYPKGQWWFQQDNAPQHTSRVARHWFGTHGVDLIDFPPYSPDLNPIENLWSMLKARVENRLVHTVEDVERVLKEEWEALDEDYLLSLASSLPARCQAVIANRGHRAPY